MVPAVAGDFVPGSVHRLYQIGMAFGDLSQHEEGGADVEALGAGATGVGG